MKDGELTGMIEVSELAVWVDTIVPGDGSRWPPASQVIPDLAQLVAHLGADDTRWLRDFARNLARCAPDERAALALQAEREAPLLFARSVQAVYRLYYTAEAVQCAVSELANAGPREASATFDPNLVASVIARRSEQRQSSPEHATRSS